MSAIRSVTAQESAPPGADYFSVFDLPRKLALDEKALERAFYRKSREVHPDRFAQASPERQQWSLEQTSLLNDAYRALKDPIARTEYLLRLEGVTVADEKSTAKPPADLLEEVFELNMQLEEMREGGDDPALRAGLEQAQRQFTNQLAGIEGQIRGEWVRWDALADKPNTPESRHSVEAMAALLDKRRYVRNLVSSVRQALGQ